MATPSEDYLTDLKRVTRKGRIGLIGTGSSAFRDIEVRQSD